MSVNGVRSASSEYRYHRNCRCTASNTAAAKQNKERACVCGWGEHLTTQVQYIKFGGRRIVPAHRQARSNKGKGSAAVSQLVAYCAV
jgi:hypothetical protein